MHKISIAAALALGLCATVATAQDALETEEEKTLYALGVAVGTNIQPFALSAAELSIVESGIRDAALGSQARVDMEVYGRLIQALAS